MELFSHTNQRRIMLSLSRTASKVPSNRESTRIIAYRNRSYDSYRSTSFTPIETSQNRSQSFQQFKQTIDSFDYDVVIDGANVGFSTSNRREASQTPFSLRVNDIKTAVDSFLDQHKRPLVILHSYHIRHLKQFHPQQLAVLDVLSIPFHHT